MIVAPVSYEADSTFLHQFQDIENFMSLQATTTSKFWAGSSVFSQWSKLNAYRKDVFEKVQGFEGNNAIASGDDVFLLEKFLRFDKESVQYYKI